MLQYSCFATVEFITSNLVAMPNCVSAVPNTRFYLTINHSNYVSNILGEGHFITLYLHGWLQCLRAAFENSGECPKMTIVAGHRFEARTCMPVTCSAAPSRTSTRATMRGKRGADTESQVAQLEKMIARLKRQKQVQEEASGEDEIEEEEEGATEDADGQEDEDEDQDFDGETEADEEDVEEDEDEASARSSKTPAQKRALRLSKQLQGSGGSSTKRGGK